MVRTVEVPKRLVKPNRKSATPAPAGPTPQQLELERLTTENARISLAQTEACEKLAAVQEDLLAAQKREASLSDLMSSAGCDTVALGPLSWSIDSAQQLLHEEEAARAALQVSCLPTIHAPPTPIHARAAACFTVAPTPRRAQELQQRISCGRARTQELVAAQTQLQLQLQLQPRLAAVSS